MREVLKEALHRSTASAIRVRGRRGRGAGEGHGRTTSTTTMCSIAENSIEGVICHAAAPSSRWGQVSHASRSCEPRPLMATASSACRVIGGGGCQTVQPCRRSASSEPQLRVLKLYTSEGSRPISSSAPGTTIWYSMSLVRLCRWVVDAV